MGMEETKENGRDLRGRDRSSAMKLDDGNLDLLNDAGNQENKIVSS